MIVTPEQLLHLATGPNVESRLIRRSGSRWSVEHAPLAPARIDKLPAKQWTVLVQGLEQYVPAARMLLDRFNFVPYARLDDLMASYATSGGGVGPHYDSYDVFLVQAYGRRTWRIGPLADDTLLDAPLKLLARFIPEQEFLLEPGDMLYLPPRWAHDGVAEDECITLSIGFRAPDAREFAGQLWYAIEDSIGEDQRYHDPELRPARHPAAISERMLDNYEALLRGFRPDRSVLEQFLGRYLTEPKAHVVFDEPLRALSRNGFTSVVLEHGFELKGATRMLYRANWVFINGECVAAEPGPTRALLRRLADQRRVVAPPVLTGAAGKLLYAWYRQGYLNPMRSSHA